MSKKNLKNQVAAQEAKENRKAERERMEPIQKALNAKSAKCRQCIGSIMMQNAETRKEILATIAELDI